MTRKKQPKTKPRLRALRTFSWPYGDIREGAEFEAGPHPKGWLTAREMADHLVKRGFAEIITSPTPEDPAEAE
jgi:hypothetical protein